MGFNSKSINFSYFRVLQTPNYVVALTLVAMFKNGREPSSAHEVDFVVDISFVLSFWPSLLYLYKDVQGFVSNGLLDNSGLFLLEIWAPICSSKRDLNFRFYHCLCCIMQLRTIKKKLGRTIIYIIVYILQLFYLISKRFNF